MNKKKYKRLYTNNCVRCWLSKKTVREEWSKWCYHYWWKVAERHLRYYFDVDVDEVLLNKDNNNEKE